MKLEERIQQFQLKTDDRDLIINGDHLENGKQQTEEEKIKYIPKSCQDIARCILAGHFEVKQGDTVLRRVYPTCVELYYHEEGEAEDAIKDFIVYHRNRPGKDPVPLFKMGTFNTHQSGIDITFEHTNNRGEMVRASALIRGFRVDDKAPDNRSTYLYEALFSDLSIFSGFHIVWRDGEEEVVNLGYGFRQNVLPFKLADKCTEEEKKNRTLDYAYKITDKKIKNDGRCWKFTNLNAYPEKGK